MLIMKNEKITAKKIAIIVWGPIVFLAFVYIALYQIFAFNASNAEAKDEKELSDCQAKVEIEDQKALAESKKTGVYIAPFGCQSITKDIHIGILGFKYYGY